MSAKVLIERMELVRHIVDEAQRIAPDRITFHWSHPCQVASLGIPPHTARSAQRSLRVQAISASVRRLPTKLQCHSTVQLLTQPGMCMHVFLGGKQGTHH